MSVRFSLFLSNQKLPVIEAIESYLKVTKIWRKLSSTTELLFGSLKQISRLENFQSQT